MTGFVSVPSRKRRCRTCSTLRLRALPPSCPAGALGRSGIALGCRGLKFDRDARNAATENPNRARLGAPSGCGFFARRCRGSSVLGSYSLRRIARSNRFWTFTASRFVFVPVETCLRVALRSIVERDVPVVVGALVEAGHERSGMRPSRAASVIKSVDSAANQPPNLPIRAARGEITRRAKFCKASYGGSSPPVTSSKARYALAGGRALAL